MTETKRGSVEKNGASKVFYILNAWIKGRICMKRKVIGEYVNGNYNVILLSDGTKIRYNKLDNLTPSRPESIDIKITNRCDRGCQFCHEKSCPDGEHGDVMNQAFLDSIPAFTELAIGGGNPLDHPDLVDFLKECKGRDIITSMTVSQVHFERDYEKIKKLVDDGLVYGLGVSLNQDQLRRVGVTDEFVEKVSEIDNTVIHVINGVVIWDQLQALYDRGLRLLILGYKNFGRGKSYSKGDVIIKRMNNFRRKRLKVFLPEIIKHFDVVSFDNLAIGQLSVKDILPAEDWGSFYMGNDGQFTMYIDVVKKQYAVSSTSEKRHSYTPGKTTLGKMFKKIQEDRYLWV